MIFNLVYVSTTTSAWSRSELLELLAQCRSSNAERDVTGMLLYRDGKIMQLLEGEEQTVRDLFDKISGDPRHTDVITIWSGHDENGRAFPDWTMGFRDLEEKPVDTAGFNDYFDRTPTVQELTQTTNLGQELLQMFRKFD